MVTRLVFVVLILLGNLPAFAAEEAEGQHLSELLKQRTYLSAWKAMLSGESIPGWVASYAKTFDGPSAPAEYVPVGETTYTLSWVCKTHDCGYNQLYVLFSPYGKRAWGLLLTGEDKRKKWLGRPDVAIEAAILSGVE